MNVSGTICTGLNYNVLTGFKSIPVDKKQHPDVWWSLQMSLVQTRGGSGQTWRVRLTKEPVGGEHHRYVQAGVKQVRQTEFDTFCL